MLNTIIPFFLLLSAATSGTNPSDAAAMRSLAESLSGDESLGWDSSADPCTWSRVSCSASRVTAIQVGNRSLSGSLPPTLGNLTSLSRLEFQNNRISGPLPSLRGLSRLEVLLLHNNLFTSMPPDFFSDLSALQSFSLDYNPFDPWQLPDSLRDASTLVNFSANSVKLTGGVPQLFAGSTFPVLNHLALANNLLKGPLPDGFAGSPITSLWLNQGGDSAGLSGSIDVIQNMTNLVQLWLHSNNFSGPLPDFSALVNLEECLFRDNGFTGPVPQSLISLPSLTHVSLTNNLLQGPVPVFPKKVQADMDPKSERFCLPDPGECDGRVSVMLSVAKSFGYPRRFAENWKGNDPCSGWLGVSCNSGGNVTVVNFRNMGLGGTISPDFSMLPALQKLILSGNGITGTIPESLTSLLSLKELDVSNNLLHGVVPKFRADVVVITSGNPDIGKDIGDKPPEGGPSSSGDSGGGKSSPGSIVGGVLGAIVALLLIGGLGLHLYKKKNRRRRQNTNTVVIHPRHSGSGPDFVKIAVADSNSGAASTTVTPDHSGPSDVHIIETGNMVISIQVLREVTNNFSKENILGQGGFGTVYKGELHDGTKIAVKRMESGVMGSKGSNEFQSEIDVLTKVRHRHLVSLLGYCLDGNERLLVYEHMPQGTLSRHLFHWKVENLEPLEWKRRLSIALDVARGVEYLHSLANQIFIHRDLKPSNILLGDDMKAKVADFGLVRLAPDGISSIETRLAGTFGYLAPEYAVTGRVTTKVDVFSFGVILMELITGRKALDDSQPEESIHLVTWFRRMLLNKDSFPKAIDPIIDLEEESLVSISTVAELAGHCCAREPYQRPVMSHVVNVLSSLAETWKPAEPDSEDGYGIDLDMTLSQALLKWQALDGNTDVGATSITSLGSTHKFLGSTDNTQSSIPTASTDFSSIDAR